MLVEAPITVVSASARTTWRPPVRSAVWASTFCVVRLPVTVRRVPRVRIALGCHLGRCHVLRAVPILIQADGASVRARRVKRAGTAVRRAHRAVRSVVSESIAMPAAPSVRGVEVSCALSSYEYHYYYYYYYYHYSSLHVVGTVEFFPSSCLCSLSLSLVALSFFSSLSVQFIALFLFSTAPGPISYRTTFWALVKGETASPLSIVPPVDYGFPNVTLFSIAPSLPAGLVFDAATGKLSGTPATLLSALSFTVTLANAVGNSSVVLSISVGKWVDNILARCL